MGRAEMAKPDGLAKDGRILEEESRNASGEETTTTTAPCELPRGFVSLLLPGRCLELLNTPRIIACGFFFSLVIPVGEVASL